MTGLCPGIGISQIAHKEPRAFVVAMSHNTNRSLAKGLFTGFPQMDIPDYPINWLPHHEDDRIIPVGWLSQKEEFPRGEVTREFVVALFHLLLDPWQPVIAMGVHGCQFCEFSGGPDSFRLFDSNDAVSMGRDNLYVPGDGCVFVAPSLVIHYIDAHQYCPPQQFQQAVLDCPQMRSMEYLKALRANAPESLIRLRRAP